MSYHGLGQPQFSSTAAFAQAVDPYSFRFSPPGAITAPYGWGPDFNIGMPMRYTHHIGYERVPTKPRPAGTRQIGPMYDELWPYAHGTSLEGCEIPSSGKPMRIEAMSKLVMWTPGWPRVPKGATHFCLEKMWNDKMWTRFFDAHGRDLGVRMQKWTQTFPVAPDTKTPMVYTRTGQWGPPVTPEGEVDDVPMDFPHEHIPQLGNYSRG